MTLKLNAIAALALAASLSGALALASDATPHKKHKAKKAATTSTATQEQIDALRRDLQNQIDALKNDLAAKDAALRDAQQKAADAEAAADKANAATAGLSDNAAAVSTLQTSVNELKSNDAAIVSTVQDVQTHAAKKSELSDLAFGKVKIGATFYGGWSYYNSTGYGQQWMDAPTEELPPGNDGFNTFEINRAYINLNYTPNDRVTLRITPDIYRNSDGSYTYRLKYAYADIQNIFGKGAFKQDKITFGQTQQPLTDWEEGLSGYRYTYLTPWNYLSISSTYGGIRLHGPIEFHGKEYVDYDLGVYNNQSFHAVEVSDTKQFMFRGTVYPFGTKADRTGLGFTIFNDFGYKSAQPSAAHTSLDRLAAIVSYQTSDKANQIAFEYDWGHNAYGTSNLFNGTGAPSGAYADFGTAATAALAGNDTHQQGFDIFGHLGLGKSHFALFGLYQYFQPNTDYDYKTAGYTNNPVDFGRIVGGMSYSISKQFSVALGDENFHWQHPQGLPTGGDMNGIVLWTQYSY